MINLFVGLLVLCFSTVGYAQVPALNRADNLMTWLERSTSGNSVTLNQGPLNSTNVPKWELLPSQSSGDLKAKSSGKLPIGGSSVPVDVIAKVPKAAVAKAIANFAVKVVAPIQVGVAVWDLVKELNMVATQDATGALKLSKTVDSSGLTYEGQHGVQYDSWNAACASLANGPGLELIGETYIYGSGPYCTVDDHIRAIRINNSIKVVQGAAGTKEVSVSRQEFEDAVAQKSGWPDSSAIARALKDAINSGETVQVVPTSVTGPSTTPGTSSVTNNNTTTNTSSSTGPTTNAGSTTTTTTTNNYSYAGPTVTVTNTTTSTTVDNSTGDKTTTTTNQTAPEKDIPEKDDPATDTPLSAVPKLYTPVYPRGLEGVWDDQKAAMSGTSLARLIPSLMPSVGNSGQCPTMPINLNLSSWANFGTVDVAPPCFLWDFGKVVIIMSALLLARGLVFGG